MIFEWIHKAKNCMNLWSTFAVHKLLCLLLIPAGQAILEDWEILRGVTLLKVVGHWGQTLGVRAHRCEPVPPW